ncbi:hypothetical protein [Kitasatospora kifunensis]|uniref:Ig-like domain-containing protein n=1 Tax=Kitasatospora kifunensis TaxID=58351 RepID=A0A7W7R277_KITKI|nr:hypothetical protein [Kitasatospora kifunensis]MBB4924048.1 hypothetical protein [Kitasatospora kifunensis]
MSTYVVVKSVEVTPDPPTIPAQTRIVIKGEVLRRMRDGVYLDVVVKRGLATFVASTLELLDELKAAGSVPSWQKAVEPGPITLTLPTLQSLGASAEEGEYLCRVRAMGWEDELLFGVDVTVAFRAATAAAVSG